MKHTETQPVEATMIHQPRPTPAPAARPAVPCRLDRHLGPFEPIDELRGWLGTEWYNCSACRSTLTRDTALSQRCAA